MPIRAVEAGERGVGERRHLVASGASEVGRCLGLTQRRMRRKGCCRGDGSRLHTIRERSLSGGSGQRLQGLPCRLHALCCLKLCRLRRAQQRPRLQTVDAGEVTGGGPSCGVGGEPVGAANLVVGKRGLGQRELQRPEHVAHFTGEL